MIAVMLLAVRSTAGQPASPARAVEFAIRVEQIDLSGNPVPLITDTVVAVDGVATSGFFPPLSIDLTVRSADSERVAFDVQASTFSVRVDRSSKQFRVEYGLPASIGPLTGKQKSVYQLKIVPLARTTVDTTGCSFNLGKGGQFRAEPTAHTDLWYVDQTLGDFQWMNYKGLFESRFDRLDSVLHLAIPGKYQVYLSPCLLPELFWDSRFSIMVDPSRSSCFVVLNPAMNSADPFALALAAVWKNFGYAPPLIAEGLAGYQSHAIVEMRTLLEGNQEFSLAPYLSTASYLQADPQTADLVASSLAAFLIDRYGSDRYLAWYRAADDLNQRETLLSTFDMPLDEIERAWKDWIANAAVPAVRYAEWIDEAEALQDYQTALSLTQTVLASVLKRSDSVVILDRIARYHFFLGNYEAATEVQDLKKSLDSLAVDISHPAYLMMQGKYDEAKPILLALQISDSANPAVPFNLGVLAAAQGNLAEAKKQWRLASAKGTGSGAQEAAVLLAHQLLASSDVAEHKSAAPMLARAVQRFGSVVGRHMVSPQALLWSGAAWLGQGNTTDAYAALMTADFVERRPLYRGMISLWLGRLHDLRGERDMARRYYQRVIDLPSAAYTKTEAEQHLLTVFRLP